MITVDARILENSYTSAEWVASNPILPDRVLGYDTTVLRYKMGDGVTAWNSLPFWNPSLNLAPVKHTYASGSAISQFIALPAGFPESADLIYWEAGQRFYPAITQVFSGSTLTGWNIVLNDDGSGTGITGVAGVVWVKP